MPDKENSISSTFTIIMVVFAVVIDLSQIILDAILIGIVVNRIIDVIVTFGFWFAFKLAGINFTKTCRNTT